MNPAPWGLSRWAFHLRPQASVSGPAPTRRDPASDAARGPAASGQRLTGLGHGHLRLDPLQPVAAQTSLQGAHLALALTLRVMGDQPVHQHP